MYANEDHGGAMLSQMQQEVNCETDSETGIETM